MKTIIGLTLAVSALLSVVPLSAVAQYRDHNRVWRGDIRHFDRHDGNQWRSGAWRHGSHAGRMGWWWVTGGMWYYYPQPVYPFPDPYRPPMVIVETAPAPPMVVQIPAPVQAAPPLPAAAVPTAPQVWYFCDAAQGYYPYIASCPGGWKTVPATPPGAPQ